MGKNGKLDRAGLLKIQLQNIWKDGRLRAAFGPVWWHDNPARYGGYDESTPVPLFYKSGKWTPNKSPRRKYKKNDLLKKS